MNANPLPVAEFLAPAPGSAPAGPVVADLPNSADPRTAATFAALLQSAGFAADALATEESVEIQRAEPAETVTDAATPGSALEGMLFLAHMHATPAAPGTTGQENATPPSAERTSGSAARLAALGPPRGAELPDTALAPRVEDTGRAPLAATSAIPPPLGMPSGEAAKRQPLEAVAFDFDPDVATASESAGARAALKADSPPAFVLPSLENAKRPAVEALAAETKPGVAASLDPTPSMTASTNALSSTTTPVVVEIDTPVTDASWRGEVAGRVASLVTRGVEHAELRLSPADLGPVEVRIDMRGGEATLAIVAAQATTRDALEQALPLLRDMLAQQGLSLGEATVRDGRADGKATSDEQAAARAGNDTRPEAIDADEVSALRPGLIRRLVDVFA